MKLFKNTEIFRTEPLPWLLGSHKLGLVLLHNSVYVHTAPLRCGNYRYYQSPHQVLKAIELQLLGLPQKQFTLLKRKTDGAVASSLSVWINSALHLRCRYDLGSDSKVACSWMRHVARENISSSDVWYISVTFNQKPKQSRHWSTNLFYLKVSVM